MTVAYYVARNGTCTLQLHLHAERGRRRPVPAGIGATRELQPAGRVRAEEAAAVRRLRRRAPAAVALAPYACDGAKRAGAAEPGAAHGAPTCASAPRSPRRRSGWTSPTRATSPTSERRRPGRPAVVRQRRPYADEGERFLAVQVTTKGRSPLAGGVRPGRAAARLPALLHRLEAPERPLRQGLGDGDGRRRGARRAAGVRRSPPGWASARVAPAALPRDGRPASWPRPCP